MPKNDSGLGLDPENFIPENLVVRSSGPGEELGPEDVVHLFERRDCYALWAAYAAGRPLLLGGQSGTGKTQMARAIAQHLGWGFVAETINGDSELNDLHWSFDAVARLAEAQTLSLLAKTSSKDEHSSEDERSPEKNDPVRAIDPVRFLAPGTFWKAFDWKTRQPR